MLDAVRLVLNDNGKEKTFLIKRMSALKAENWLIRAGLLIGKESDLGGSADGITGLLKAISSIEYEKAMPLLNELLEGVYFVSGELQKGVLESPDLIDSPLTLLKLRVESAKANFGFLANGDTLGYLFNLSSE